MDLLTLGLFIVGLALLIFGAEVLVRGASRLATAIGISPLVVGLTVVAFGTSSPEIAVSLQSAFTGRPEIALGNAVGSNIFNVLLILGVSALIAPLVVSKQLVRLDVPIMMAASLLLFLLALDGRLGRLEGALLFLGALFYLGFTVIKSRQENSGVKVKDEITPPGGVLVNVGAVVLGLALLVLGSRWLVAGAVALATVLGVSELIIGLTIIAAGTSLPEVATSVIASLRGERDIAVGNVIGSNLFNILVVLGLTALVAPEGIPVPASALAFDLPIMTAVAFACLPIFFTGYRIDRWEGGLFLGYYLAYILFLFLNATEHAALPYFNAVMLAFVLPLTAVTLFVLVLRSARGKG
jgi:cation:H+ antiporter